MRIGRTQWVRTLAVHAGQTVDLSTGAVTLPIHLSTTFERDPQGDYPHSDVLGGVVLRE